MRLIKVFHKVTEKPDPWAPATEFFIPGDEEWLAKAEKAFALIKFPAK